MNILLFMLLVYNQDSCKLKYRQYILDSKVSYFLVVKAKKNNEIVDVVLTNNQLFYHLNKPDSVFKDIVKTALINETPIFEVSDTTEETLGIVEKTAYIEKIKKKGKTNFINYFFEKNGYPKNRKETWKFLSEIVKVLFEWNVLVVESDNNVAINKTQLCN